MKISNTLLLVIISLSGFFAGCSTTIELTSVPVKNKILIDGNASDWGTNLKYLSDEKVALGVTNDNNYLYLCLTTANMSKVMPMFVGGFNVWVENEGNEGNKIGIRYPINNIVSESRIMLNPGEFRERGRDMIISKMINKQDEIRILNKDNFPVTVISTSDSSGLKAHLGFNNGQFVYELRLPLKLDEQNKYGINAVPGNKLLIKFETEKPDRGDFTRRNDEGEMRPPGSIGNFSGEERREGRRTEDREGMPFEPIDFSVEVTLR